MQWWYLTISTPPSVTRAGGTPSFLWKSRGKPLTYIKNNSYGKD